jgi:hypothetical protein
MDIIDNNDIKKLFICHFDTINNNNKDYKTIYAWTNMKEYFNKLLEILINFDLNKKNRQEYVKYYIFTKFFYIFYVNYLEYSDHDDATNNEIDIFNESFKYNLKIIYKIHSSHKNPLKLLNFLNPFFKNVKSHYNNDDDTFLNICKTNKKYENINLSNNNIKKIVNLITFNHNMVVNLDYKNYSHFYYKNIIDRKHYFNNNFIDFTSFVNDIPTYKNLILINVDDKDGKESSCNKINVRISNVIKFILKYFPYLSYSRNTDKKGGGGGSGYVISNTKNDGKIIIEKSNETTNIIFQYNLNLFYLNNPEVTDITYLKKTNNFIKIKYQNNTITDLTSLLNMFYYITRSCKYLDFYSSNIDELLNIEKCNYCFYDTFFYFLTFIKNDILENNVFYKKFVVDIVKYFYLYSYYDYYFYNDTELVMLLNSVSDSNEKYKIFEKFCTNIKKLFKIPNELLFYPPFFNIENCNDNVFFYSYDYINYLKLYDIVYSICTVFKLDADNNNVCHIINNFISIAHTDKNEDVQDSAEGTEDEGNDKEGNGDMDNGDMDNGDMDKSDKGNGDKGKSDTGNSDTGNSDKGKSDTDKNDTGNSDTDKNDTSGSISYGISTLEPKYNNNSNNSNNKFLELSDNSSENYILNTEH